MINKKLQLHKSMSQSQLKMVDAFTKEFKATFDKLDVNDKKLFFIQSIHFMKKLKMKST